MNRISSQLFKDYSQRSHSERFQMQSDISLGISPLRLLEKSGFGTNLNDDIDAQGLINKTQSKQKRFSLSTFMNRLSARFKTAKSSDQNEQISKDLFSVFDSTVLLTSRAIGVGFLYFPAVTDWSSFTTGNSFLILTLSSGLSLIGLNFFQGVYSSYLILKIRCHLTNYT